jgi:hypothetical protein
MLKRAMIASRRARTSQGGSRLPRRRRRQRPIALAVLVVIGLALSGCNISSGFTYVSHRSPDGTILGFKLPNQWKTFDTQQVYEASNGPLTSAETKSISAGQWAEAFSDAPHPKALSVSAMVYSKYPVGFAEARPLNPQERDGFSFVSLRSEILGEDPENATSPDPFHVTNDSEFANSSNGIRGSRLSTNIKLSSGATATLSQIVEVDANTDWVFAVTVICTASCWGPNSGVINQVLKSWTVKETK